MGLLDTRVEHGRRPDRPLFALIYGEIKVGKSTLAAGAPAPLFLDAEQGTLGLDVQRLRIDTWGQFLDALQAILVEKHPYRTVVLDTLDALERQLATWVCQNAQVESIEAIGGGYGKGWTRVAEAWEFALQLIAQLHAKGLNVLALAHAGVETFRDPGGAEWARYGLKLNKKSAGIWTGRVEEVLFATREVTADKRKAKGSRRVLHTVWSPAWDAGNRRGLPPRLDLSWKALSDALRRSVELERSRRSDQEYVPDVPDESEAPAAEPETPTEPAASPPGAPPPAARPEPVREPHTPAPAPTPAAGSSGGEAAPPTTKEGRVSKLRRPPKPSAVAAEGSAT